MHNKPVEQDCKALQMLSLLIEEVHSLKMLLLNGTVQSASPQSNRQRCTALGLRTDECATKVGTLTMSTKDAYGASLTADYLTAKEVATLLHVSVRHVFSLANRHELPAIRLGKTWRFDRNDLMNWIRAQSGKAE